MVSATSVTHSSASVDTKPIIAQCIASPPFTRRRGSSLFDLAVEGTRLHVESPHRLHRGDFTRPPLCHDGCEVGALDRFASLVHTALFGYRYALALALQNILALELRHRAEHRQHELAARRRGVDRLLLGHEAHFLFCERLDKLEQVAGVAREAADGFHDDRVAFANVGEHLLEFGTVGVLSARAVDVQLGHAELAHEDFLTDGVLLGGAHTDVADFQRTTSFLNRVVVARGISQKGESDPSGLLFRSLTGVRPIGSLVAASTVDEVLDFLEGVAVPHHLLHDSRVETRALRLGHEGGDIVVLVVGYV